MLKYLEFWLEYSYVLVISFSPGHSSHCESLLASLRRLLHEAFSLCYTAMEPHLETAFQFCQPVQDRGGEDKVETDVEVLKATLSSLRQQQSAIKGIKDSRSIAFFKVEKTFFLAAIF